MAKVGWAAALCHANGHLAALCLANGHLAGRVPGKRPSRVATLAERMACGGNRERSRLPARLDGPSTSCSCSCCASSWRLRFGQAPRIMSVNSAGRSLGGAAPPYRLAIRRPSRPRRHHASPRGSITRADAARAAARPVHFQHDSTRSFTISQKLQERSPRNFTSGTVVPRAKTEKKVQRGVVI